MLSETSVKATLRKVMVKAGNLRVVSLS